MLADIVEFLVTTGPQNQTRIMQACNLRYDQTAECLTELAQSKLIEKNEGGKTYRVTQLGIDFLKRWTEIFKDFLVGHTKKKHFWEK